MSLLSSFLSTTLLISLLIRNISSQCSNLESATCTDDGYCAWNANSDCVCGATSWDQDIAFVFDSSMDELEWFYTTKFAADLLYYGSPSSTTTRAAIITTGTTAIDPTIALSFGDEPLNTTIATTLPQLQQIAQADFFLERALQSAVDVFNSSSSPARRKILIIFASELYFEIPCRVNMRKHEVYTYTIAIGSWDSYGLLCVGSTENNYEGLQTVSDASQLTDVLLPVMEAITCPHHPLLKVTEIQLAGVLGEQYFEIYNYGHDINDMSTIELNGIGSGPLNANTPLTQGGIAVVYNTDSSLDPLALPDCATCACTELTSGTQGTASIKWCDTAVYYGCCDSTRNRCGSNQGFETILSDCEWDGGLSMAAFTLELLWTNPNTLAQITLESLAFDTVDQWPTVATGYALELKNKGYNNKFGSSWSMSCDADGSPGDDYLSVPCVYDCTTEGNATCNLNGGMSLDGLPPGCVFSTKSCNCLPGYYSYYRTCLPLPQASDCLDTQVNTAASDVSFLVAPWDGDTAYTYRYCSDLDGCTGITISTATTHKLRFRINSGGRVVNWTTLAVSAIGSHNPSYYWVGDYIKCNATTAEPTKSPTPSPTFSVPTVPSCSIVLSKDLRSFQITWEPLDMMQFGDTAADLDQFAGYVFFFNSERRNGGNPAPCCTVAGTTSGSVPFDLALDQVSVSGDWDSVLTDVDEAKEESSATLCSVITQIPTPSPSKSPSRNPSPSPSKSPSRIPTASPTLRELYVPSCAATVLPGTTTFDMSWVPATFGGDTALDTETSYVLEWFYNNGRSPGAQMVSADEGPRPISVPDYLNVTYFQIHCVWRGSSFGRKTNCTITTIQPTPAPTDVPSETPTKHPTTSPSKSPSRNPSEVPTSSPTYSYDDVTWCHAIVGRSFDSVYAKLLWGLLDADASNPALGKPEWINYVGMIGGIEIPATHDAAYIRCNATNPSDCWGQASKSLSSNTGTEIDVSQVTFYAYYTDGGNTLFTTSTINCTVDTPEPTKSPSSDPTKAPTLSPTLGEVWVYLDATQCEEERCGCVSTSFDENPDCCYNACDWDRQPAPVFIVQEKEESNTTFWVRRNMAEYPYVIEIGYNITAVTDEVAWKYGFYKRMEEIEQKIQAGNFTVDDFVVTNNSNITVNETAALQNVSWTIPDDCYFDAWDDKKCPFYIETEAVIDYDCSGGKKRENEKNTCSWCDFYEEPGPRCNDIKPNSGKIVIPHTDLSGFGGSTFEQTAFDLEIKTEGCTDGCDLPGEVFMLELTSCTVIYNYDDLNATELEQLGANPRDVMDCTLIYPTRAYILVNDADVIDIVEEEVIENTSYNEWLWYVIAGAVVVLAILSYFAHMWWKHKKSKEEDVAVVEEEMEEVVAGQELGWQGGDDIIEAPANPLATIGGVQRPVETMGAAYDPNANKKMADIAEVGIEKFDVRMEYGQKMGGGQNLPDDSLEEDIL